MSDLLWLAEGAGFPNRYPVAALAHLLDVDRDVAALVLDAIRTPTTAQTERDRHLTRNRVMP